jgi:hypothetical protein
MHGIDQAYIDNPDWFSVTVSTDVPSDLAVGGLTGDQFTITNNGIADAACVIQCQQIHSSIR